MQIDQLDITEVSRVIQDTQLLEEVILNERSQIRQYSIPVFLLLYCGSRDPAQYGMLSSDEQMRRGLLETAHAEM